MARLCDAEPQVFVTDMQAACDFYTGKFGFAVVFLYGEPPFYGQVARNGVPLNLRHVDTLPIDPAQRDADDLLTASITVQDIDQLHREFTAAGAPLHQALRTEPWGARTFVVKDPDGNLLLFAE